MSDIKILNYSLEYLLGDRFGRYSKFVIQDRALPDVRDGLKPVQRRILYAMYVDANTHVKPHRKSAKTVGSVIANYHPHGDSSVYEAMVRMSQWWKLREPLIDIHGNNGSLDDDPPAAMRYTETRLSKISGELLKDIDYDTVSWSPNFDDTILEPTVLPARFPNLLVNGSRGVASGYATFIPSHNLKEVIDATIYRMKNPTCSLEDLLPLIQGPDLPTGGIIHGNQGIIDAFRNGSGSFQVVSKYEWLEQKNMVSLIVLEIPFDVVKSDLVTQIDRMRMDKVIDGIIEVRDESDRTGLRIVIDLKKDTDTQGILQYLLKKTSLSIRLNYNMVAIVNKRPMLIGLLPILDAYIAHQIEVTTKRTQYELRKAQARFHIVEGLIIAISNLTEVIEIIRSSKDKSDSKNRLETRFNLDEIQSEAIVVLQLYRLSSTDVEGLQKEATHLQHEIDRLSDLLEKPEKLKHLIMKELTSVATEYTNPRRTVILDNELDFGTIVKPITKEDVMVVITRDGYFKRSSLKSFASTDASAGYKNGDMIIAELKANTVETLLCFTNFGNYLLVPVHELTETKWRDEGSHISNFIALTGNEKIIRVFLLKTMPALMAIILITKKGQIKKTKLTDFTSSRMRRPIKAMVIDKNDYLVDADMSDGDSSILVVTNLGNAIHYHESMVSLIGMKTSGVKAIQKTKEETIAGMIVQRKNEEVEMLLLSDQGGQRLLNPSGLSLMNRLGKTQELVKSFKTEPHQIIRVLKYDGTSRIDLLSETGKIISITLENQKPLPFGKPLRRTIDLQTLEMMMDASHPRNTLVISASIPTFEPVIPTPIIEESIVDAEENDESSYNFTIYDYIDDDPSKNTPK